MWCYLGYFAAIFIGFSLGIMGDGGSILTVLVYLIGVHLVLSTAYSLLVLETTSLVGPTGYFRKGLISGAHGTGVPQFPGGNC